jgi:uncharacterized membrane protein (GlpM family)
MSGWTINLLLGLPWLLAVGLLYLWIYRKKHEGRRFPFTDPVLRAPGQGLANQIDDMSFDFAMYFGLIPILPLFAYAVYLQHIVTNERQLSLIAAIFLFVTAAAGTSFLIIRSLWLLKKMHYCKIGYAGEVAVGNALNQLMLQGYHVFHDVQVDKAFNIDHLVVGQSGVFAIETKTKTKLKKATSKDAYKVIFDGNALYFPDKPDYPQNDFLDQAGRGAKWVSRWLSEAVGIHVDVQPVLVMPGWFITARKLGRVMVLNHKQVQELTTVKKKPLDNATIKQIAYQIRQKCQHGSLASGMLREA